MIRPTPLWRSVAVLGVAGLVLTACGGDDDASTETPSDSGTTSAAAGKGDGTLKIGTLLPQTGSLAFLGPPEFAGVDLAIKEINEAGGVYVEEFDAQIPLELDVRDDASDPNQTTSIMDEFAGGDIVAYLGGFATPGHAAGSATAERNGIPYLGVATSTQALSEQGYQYFFTPFPKSPDMAVTVFEMLNGLIAEGDRPLNVGIFQEATDWAYDQPDPSLEDLLEDIWV